MDVSYQATDDVHVLPTNLPLPGMGVLPINAFVLRAEEPVLVDAGLGADSDAFIEALSSVIDPGSLRWVWLTHDDMDHTGALQRIFELAPNARLVTHGMGALRMSTWWPVPLDRVYAIRPGDRLPVGDRTLRAVAPPLFDNPMSTGFLDEATGALFSSDSFGAIIPEPTVDASDIPSDALAGGMRAWATIDSPWTHLVDRVQFAAVLDSLRRLQPSAVFSSHLPAAPGALVEGFLEVLASVPDADHMPAPSHEEFTQLLAALAALHAPAPAPV